MAPRLDIFATALRAAREDEGLTQQQLADRTRISVLQVKRYEAGTSEPSLDALRRLGRVLGHGVDALVYYDAPEHTAWREMELLRRLRLLPNDEREFITRAFTALLEHAEHAARRKTR